MQGFHPVGVHQVREPLTIFGSGVLTDPAQIGKDIEAQGVGIDAGIPGAVERRLIHHGGMALQEFQHEAIGDQTFFIHPVQQGVMPESGPALIHYLGLALGVKILGQLAHNTDDFPLPGFQQWCVLLDKVQQVFLGLLRVAFLAANLVLVLAGSGNGAPQVIELPLQVLLPFSLPALLLCRRDRGRALVTINAVVHQGMAGVEDLFHRIDTVSFFALRHVVTGEHQVVDNGAGIGPGAEQVIALEEGVVAVGGVGNHQRLHGQGVLLHQVGNARVRIDNDFVRQAHLAPLVAF